ncbi:hypothetical protein CRYUN_Cryun31cG0032400 [Craigia yunnanensis]
MSAARSVIRSAVFRATAATRLTAAPKSRLRPACSPFGISKQNPLSSRIFRSPVEMSCCVETLLPYHTATASALLTSMLSVSRQSSGWTPEGQCYRSVYKPDSCRSCIDKATDEFTKSCDNHRKAIVWYDECMLNYSNSSIFGKMDFEPYGALINVNNATKVTEFNQVLATLLDGLITQAVSGDSLRKFATGSADVSDSQTIYVLAQCSPDLSQVDYIFYGPLVAMPLAAVADSPVSPPIDAPPPVDAPSPSPVVTPAPPPQQTEHPYIASGEGNLNNGFQVLATVFPLMILQYFVF